MDTNFKSLSEAKPNNKADACGLVFNGILSFVMFSYTNFDKFTYGTCYSGNYEGAVVSSYPVWSIDGEVDVYGNMMTWYTVGLVLYLSLMLSHILKMIS